MFVALYPVLCALINRFRGGGLFLLPGETVDPDHKRTQVRRVAFAVVVGLLAWNPWVAAVLYLSTLTGWGFPVSAAIGARNPLDWESEFLLFDQPARIIVEKLVGQYNSRAYGVAWLTLHGLLFGSACAAASSGEFWYLLMGGMGLCYYAARDWERGEYAFGALVGVAIFLSSLTLAS